MTQTNTANGGTLTHRSGSSRKLLARKALAAAPASAGEALEDIFPTTPVENADAAGSGAPEERELTAETSATAGDALSVAGAAPADNAAAPLPATAAEAASTPVDAATPEPQPAPTSALPWSDEDEATFQALTARRKAAGYQRRGRDVSGQLLRVGDIAPNAGTVLAAIVALVAERGTLGRSALLDAMAGATFPHAKAKPSDRGWCQGYVAGAVRNGFLALVDAEPAGTAEVSR